MRRDEGMEINTTEIVKVGTFTSGQLHFLDDHRYTSGETGM